MLFNLGVIVLQNITIQPRLSGYNDSAVLNHLLIISSGSLLSATVNPNMMLQVLRDRHVILNASL